MTDIDIARKVELKHIREIAKKLDLKEDDLEMYGKYKAKLPLELINEETIANLEWEWREPRFIDKVNEVRQLYNNREFCQFSVFV